MITWMVLIVYVKIVVTGKNSISEYKIHVYDDHLSFRVSGFFITGTDGIIIMEDSYEQEFDYA